MDSPAQAVIPPPPPGFKLDAVPPPPPGFKLDDTAHNDSPKSFGDHLLSAASNFWDQVNPVKLAQGMADTVLDLKGTAKNYNAQQNEIFQKAVDSYKAGDYSSAMQHGLHYLINGVPGVGSTLDSASEQAKAGDIGGALGKTAGLATVLIGTPKIPEMAGKVADTVESARDLASRALQHPKVQGALKDAAIELAKEVPGVKTAIKVGKAASAVKGVLDDLNAPPEDPLLEQVTQRYGPEAAQSIVDRIRAAAPKQLGPGATITPPPADTSGVIPGWKPTILEKEPPAATPEATPESTAPPASFLDNETTGLLPDRLIANRAAKAQRFIKALGGTQNLPTNQSEWARLADQLGEKVPSLETQGQIEFGLNRRMMTKTETPGTVEHTTPSALSKNPKALKIAQQLQAEMERSGTAPSMPVGIKAAAEDVAKVGPTVPGVGATVTLKNGKTVIVKELHPDGTFEYRE